MSSIGIITALQSEANCLGGLINKKNIVHMVAGIGPTRAAKIATSFCENGCGGLISFGYAGALNSTHRSGLLLIGHSVSNGHETIDINSDWLTTLMKLLKNRNIFSVQMTAFLSSSIPLSNKQQKLNCSQNGNWDAVEMESYAVAKVARRYGVPVLVIRAILDEIDTIIPDGAMNFIDAEGQQNPLGIVYELLKKPLDCKKYFVLATAKTKADKTLSRVATIISDVSLP